jgi:hypothetical protein
LTTGGVQPPVAHCHVVSKDMEGGGRADIYSSIEKAAPATTSNSRTRSVFITPFSDLKRKPRRKSGSNRTRWCQAALLSYLQLRASRSGSLLPNSHLTFAAPTHCLRSAEFDDLMYSSARSLAVKFKLDRRSARWLSARNPIPYIADRAGPYIAARAGRSSRSVTERPTSQAMAMPLSTGYT